MKTMTQQLPAIRIPFDLRLPIDMQIFSGIGQTVLGNTGAPRRAGTRDPIAWPIDTAFTPTNGAMAGNAGGIITQELVFMDSTSQLAGLSTAQPPITTTTATTISAVNSGGTAVTPTSMQNIFVGSQLVIDTGTQQETVAVTAVTATTFTATFTKTHASGFAIRDRQVMLQSTTSITGGGYGTAGTGTALTVGSAGNAFTVNEYVLVQAAAAGKEIAEAAQVTAKAATTVTIATQGTYTQPFSIITLPVNTVGNTNVGSQTIVVANATNIAIGTKLLVDTVVSGVQETVTVTAVSSGNVTANFLNAHSGTIPVVAAVTNQNAANCVGVARGQYPPTLTAVNVNVPEPGSSPQGATPYIDVDEEGDFLFNTTSGDNLYPLTKLYVGADGRTVTAVATGTSIGYVSPDQRPKGGTGIGAMSVAPPTFPIAGGTGVVIYARITPQGLPAPN